MPARESGAPRRRQTVGGSEGNGNSESSIIVPIGTAAAARYDRLRTFLLRIAEHDFRQGRREHARYWLAHLREQRIQFHRSGVRGG